MGNSNWNDDAYSDRSKTRAAATRATGIDHTFKYDADVKSGRVAAAVAAILDPKKVAGPTSPLAGQICRESRDSKDHPNSKGVAVFFDTTGSMQDTPRIFQSKLGKLPGLLVRKQYLEDAHVLFGAINDATTGVIAPVQIGQFEAGIEMDDALTAMLLEGGGGGTQHESYELGLFYAARNFHLDCTEKRGEKSYLFMIGDEMAYEMIRKTFVKQYLGVDIEEDIPLDVILKEILKKFEFYFILPGTTQNWNDPSIAAFWEARIGAERFLRLEHPEDVCELIATTIGACEGKVGLSGIARDLKDLGSSQTTIDRVTKTLAIVTQGKELVRVGKSTGDLVPAGADSDVERL